MMFIFKPSLFNNIMLKAGTRIGPHELKLYEVFEKSVCSDIIIYDIA